MTVENILSKMGVKLEYSAGETVQILGDIPAHKPLALRTVQDIKEFVLYLQKNYRDKLTLTQLIKEVQSYD